MVQFPLPSSGQSWIRSLQQESSSPVRVRAEALRASSEGVGISFDSAIRSSLRTESRDVPRCGCSIYACMSIVLELLVTVESRGNEPTGR